MSFSSAENPKSMNALCTMPSQAGEAPERWAALDSLQPLLKSTLTKLIEYLQTSRFAGYDPYDGLGSTRFQKLPLRDSKWARLAVTHLCKRSPINLRSLLGVPSGRNPKGVALCISAFLKLRSESQSEHYRQLASELLAWLLLNSCRGFSGASWGYNFDWQSRTFFVPKGTPNAVCTIFAANAFLDGFEVLQDEAYLDHARGCCDFILQHLLTKHKKEIYFRYIPAQDTQIHNVNLLVAALLARVAALTREDRMNSIAHQAITFTVARARDDGSWPYGEAPNQTFIDNYHTGFNLVALARYRRYSGDDSFVKVTQNGYEFWDRSFWHKKGPKFYPSSHYPVDIHCIAQAILTYLEFVPPDAPEKIATTLRWTWQHMWSPKGYFYYQRHLLYTIRTPYLRWAQAWMLNALSALWNATEAKADCDLDVN